MLGYVCVHCRKTKCRGEEKEVCVSRCAFHRELRTKFRSMARLMEPDDYEKFITSMKSMCETSILISSLLSYIVGYGYVTEEKQLKQRIRNLMICRKHGITKSEGQLFVLN